MQQSCRCCATALLLRDVEGASNRGTRLNHAKSPLWLYRVSYILSQPMSFLRDLQIALQSALALFETRLATLSGPTQVSDRDVRRGPSHPHLILLGSPGERQNRIFLFLYSRFTVTVNA